MVAHAAVELQLGGRRAAGRGAHQGDEVVAFDQRRDRERSQGAPLAGIDREVGEHGRLAGVGELHGEALRGLGGARARGEAAVEAGEIGEEIGAHVAPEEHRVERDVAEALLGDAPERRGLGLAPGRDAVAHVDHLHEAARCGCLGCAGELAGVAQRRAEIAGAVGLDALDEAPGGRLRRGGGGDHLGRVVDLRDVGGDHLEAVVRAQLSQDGRERVQRERAALQRAARGVADDHHRARGGLARRRERGADLGPVQLDVDRGVDAVGAALLQHVARLPALGDGEDDLACGLVVPGVEHRLAAHVEPERRHLGAHLGRGGRADVGVVPGVAAQRRHVADHDALVALRLDGEDAQLEGAPVLPLQERGVAHLVDDGLVGLARLLDLDELAVHHLAADLHRQPHQRRLLGQREAEGAFQPLVPVVVEDVLDARLREIARDLGRSVDAPQREPRAPVLGGAHLQRADAGRGGRARRLHGLREGGGAGILGGEHHALLPPFGAQQHVALGHLARVVAAAHHQLPVLVVDARPGLAGADADDDAAAVVLGELDRRSAPQPQLGARIRKRAEHHQSAVHGADSRRPCPPRRLRCRGRRRCPPWARGPPRHPRPGSRRG